MTETSGEAQTERENTLYTERRNAELVHQLEQEKQNCFKKYGERDTELNIATSVARDLSKGIKNDLVNRWINHHNILDQERHRLVANARINAQLADESGHWLEVRRKELEAEYGLNEGIQ